MEVSGQITNKSAERRRKRRLMIVEHYRRNYCLPLCKAIMQNDDDAIQRLATRSLDYRFGVAMADPNGKWHNRFNDVFTETMRELKEMGWENG